MFFGGQDKDEVSPVVQKLATKYGLHDIAKSMWIEIRKFERTYNRDFVLENMNEHAKRVLAHAIACECGLRTQALYENGQVKMRLIRPNYACVSSSAQYVNSSKVQMKLALDYLSRFPVSLDEVEEHLKLESYDEKEGKEVSFFSSSVPLVPCAPNLSPMMHQIRSSLPASHYRQEILNAIEQYKVTIITGGTGCGKTTQVPQFLLEEATRNNQPIRIICTQPRRLPAIAIAERVSQERGEQVGSTVGYQIRLEQRSSKYTSLLYCTSGVLLRMLSIDPLANGVTHVILDEVHEREQNTDYLLIILREALKKRNIKLILMSATIEGNREMFQDYFSGFKPCGSCDIPSRLFNVETLYLPEILALTSYVPDKKFAGFWMGDLSECCKQTQIENYHELNKHQEDDNIPSAHTLPDLQAYDQQPQSSEWQQSYPVSHYQSPDELTRSNTVPSNLQYAVQPGFYPNQPAQPYGYDNQDVMVQQQNNVYVQQPPVQPNYFYDNTWNLPSNYFNAQQQFHQAQPHPQAYRRQMSATANPRPAPKYIDDINADYMRRSYHRREELMETQASLVNEWLPNRPGSFDPNYINELRHARINRRFMVNSYYKLGGSQYGESVDIDLAYKTINYCMDSCVEGSILVFLPGYEDILKLREKVRKMTSSHYKPAIYTLHSQMNSYDQQHVFDPAKRGFRKIILSTNIAEASLTIDDVVFVIDCGKVKQKTYEHDNRISQLKVVWIAKSNADQRAGRAGRCHDGFCFRLYSEENFHSLRATQEAEMKRSAIYELCLHAKMFDFNKMRVKDFLNLAPEPPSPQAIDRSLEFLEQIGALKQRAKWTGECHPFDTRNSLANDPDTPEAEITRLGRLIAALPLEPQLARLLLFGLALKVFYPVVTLVAALAYREPFVLPNNDEKNDAQLSRERFSRLDFSDHMLLLRVINAYNDLNPTEANQFCRRNFLSKPAINMILGIRRQLFSELKRLRVIPPAIHSIEDPELNVFSDSWTLIQGALVAGLYPAIGFIRSGTKLRKIHIMLSKNDEDSTRTMASLHPSSSLRRQVQSRRFGDNGYEGEEDRPVIECLVYQEMAQLDFDLTLRTVTAVTPLCALLFSGQGQMCKSDMDDLELMEEDYDKLLFPHFYNVPFDGKTEEDGNYRMELEEPSFAVSQGTPNKNYTRRFREQAQFAVDKNLFFFGIYRELQVLLRLKFKLMAYILKFFENPLDTFKSEYYELLRCLRYTMDLAHDAYKFQPVYDTLPNRFPLQDLSRRVLALSSYMCLPAGQQCNMFPSQSAAQHSMHQQSEESSGSPPADPAPTNSSPNDNSCPDASTSPKPSNSTSPTKQLSEAVADESDRAQSSSDQQQADSSVRENDEERTASKNEDGRNRPSASSSRKFETHRREETWQNANKHRNDQRYNQGYGCPRNDERSNHYEKSRGRLYVPPGRRDQGDVRFDQQHTQRPFRNSSDEAKRESHQKDFRQNDGTREDEERDSRNSYKQPFYHNRHGPYRNNRGGHQRIYSNQNYKRGNPAPR